MQPEGQLRPGWLAVPEKPWLLFFVSLQSTLKTWMFISVSHFSLHPDNSHIKSGVTSAGVILFGLFLFLYTCFTSLLL